MKKTRYFKNFIAYVARNILSMIGVSAYILADTFFISRAEGADGLTVLNLALPIYGFIYAIGGLIGVGTATRHAILKAEGRRDIDGYFSNAVMWSIIASIPFVLFGIFSPSSLLYLFGGRGELIALGTPYFRYMLLFTPFFACQYIASGFVRNDGDPNIAMIASLSASTFNILFDYILMFPLGMGLSGAALATACAPIVNITISSTHFLKKTNTVRFVWHLPDFKMLLSSMSLGVSAMVGELSSAVTTTVFNFLLLDLGSNIAVAAYGVIANLAIVANAIYNGITQGVQPLISDSYGRREGSSVRTYLNYALGLALITTILMILLAFGLTDQLVSIFNSEGNQTLAALSHDGLRIYFCGYVFAGINIILVGYFAATDQPKIAFYASVMRGIIAICLCGILLGKLFGITGVWLSYLAAELLTSAFIAICLIARKKR